MNRAGLLCRDPGTLIKHKKNPISDYWYMTTKPVQLAGIPGGNFPSNQACQVAQRMYQARNKTVGNILIMHIAFLAHVIRPLL